MRENTARKNIRYSFLGINCIFFIRIRLTNSIKKKTFSQRMSIDHYLTKNHGCVSSRTI